MIFSYKSTPTNVLFVGGAGTFLFFNKFTGINNRLNNLKFDVIFFTLYFIKNSLDGVNIVKNKECKCSLLHTHKEGARNYAWKDIERVVESNT